MIKQVSWDEVVEAWEAHRHEGLTLLIRDIVRTESDGHRHMVLSAKGYELMVDLDTPMRVAHRGGLRAVLETP